MLAQAVAIAGIASTSAFAPWLAAAVLLGIGTAMVYPTLIAVVADVAEPRRRGAVTGVYRFWRDLGFVVGAILVGVLVDRFDARVAILCVAALTAASGAIVAIRMQETHPSA
jgi:MFS family permease